MIDKPNALYSAFCLLITDHWLLLSALCPLSEDPTHLGPGNLADGKETDRPEDDENEAKGSSFVR